ncbi:FAD assembly factor SdhE [Halotalea alkalilenta]|uniref:FAD assembly factor SdhE n=1 Tax=Halotalea alkalilenta TaxID=376489 RepID=A0A172YF38_9GAMM|nr:succinate dehydrogenase assembly factor 2 [Halotalea alkalilenta]ANF57575.1 hypothetical protein A5892_08945 [Halotalea alkalilenta]
MFDEASRKRLQWHSRRGMWELDMMLRPFFDACFDSLDPQRQLDFQRLLAREDQELFVWLMRRELCDDASLQPIIDDIVAYARERDEVNVRPI